MDWVREKKDYIIKPVGLVEVNYYKCRLCDCGFSKDNGEEFEFISENNSKYNHFICDSCLDTIINSDKCEEWY